MSRARQIVFTITLAVGIYLVVVPFALSLFSRTSDAEKLSDYYRPLMSERGLDIQRTNLGLVNAAGTEFYGVTLPEIRRQLNMDEAQFDAFVSEGYPHVAAFLQRAPEVVEYLNPALKAVIAQGDNFEAADAFPFENLDVRVGPWSLLALGLALIVVALFIRAGTSWIPLSLVTVVGFGLLIGPPVLGWFGQTDAAEQVAVVARGPFTPTLANTTVGDTVAFDAAITEMQESMFPAIGARLGMSEAQLDAYLHDSFPDTMRFLDAWDDDIYRRARRLSLSQIRFMDEFHNADATPYTALPWFFMIPGAVLFIGGVYGLLAARRQSRTTRVERD